MINFLKIKKIISVLLVVTMLASFSPLTTQAVVGTASGAAVLSAATTAATTPIAGSLYLGTGYLMTADYGTRIALLSILSSSLGVTPGVAQKEDVWDMIAYFAARVLLRQVTQSIVNWINSGFQGNPSFVQNPQKFLTDYADRTIGEFVFGSDLAFLCDPFETNIRLKLGLLYTPFKDKINCTLSDILQNVDGSITNAYKDFVDGDFIGGGGWASWLNMTTIPQNNQIGAGLLAEAELEARLGDIQTTKKDELSWSGGLLSMKNCTRTTTDVDGVVTTETYTGDPIFKSNTVKNTARIDDAGNWAGTTEDACQVVTPGVWITGTGNKVLGLELDRLGAADEINEIVGALANFVITKVMEKGVAMIKGNTLSPNDPSYQEGIARLQDMQNNDMNSAGSNMNYQPNYSTYSNASPQPGPTTPGTKPNGSVDFAETYPNKEAALVAIEAQSTIETQYLSTQNNIFSLLNKTQEIFASSTCSVTIKNEVTSQITGSVAYDKTLPANLSWNKTDIVSVSSTTINNIYTLNQVKSSINSSLDDSAIPGLMQVLTTINTFHSPLEVGDYSPGGVLFDKIKTWISGRITTNQTCAGDVSGLTEWGIQ